MPTHLRSLLLFACFSFFSEKLFCHTPGRGNDSLICLKVEAIFENVFDHNKDPFLVRVYKEDILIDSVTVTYAKKKFVYLFERNSLYRFSVSKAGFVPMLVQVDTWLPVEKANVLYRFEFETRLFSEKRARTLNRELLSKPLAIIRYNAQKKAFYHDDEYTRSLKLNMAINAKRW